MLALVKNTTEPLELSLRQVDEPAVTENDVKIRVIAAGICGSDLHFYHGKGESMTFFPPVILGHEFSGEIFEVGKNVKNWKVGDRVTSEPPIVTCGTCEFCHRGLPALCSSRRSLGSGVNGAFAEFVVVSPHRLHRLPDNVDFISAAIAEPAACCVHAVLEQSDIKVGDLVLVTGPGPIGLLVSQLAKAQGGRVILVGVSSDLERLSLGEKLGVETIINADIDNVEDTVQRLSNGKGVEFAFECSGVNTAAQSCIKSLKKTGHYVQVGVHTKPVSLDFNQVVTKEIHILGSFGSTFTAWERALLLISRGDLQTKALVSGEFPLNEWQKAFNILENKNACKLIFRPGIS